MEVTNTYAHRIVRTLATLLGAAFGAAQAGPLARDIGAMELTQPTAPIQASVALKLRNPSQLQQQLVALHTPGNAQFRRFLTPAQFRQQYAPSQATVDQALAYFRAKGLTANVGSGGLVKVKGPLSAVQAAFNVKLHLYEISTAPNQAAHVYHAPVGRPSLSSPQLAAQFAGVVGLDTRPNYIPHLKRVPQALRPQARRPSGAPNATINMPGDLTVLDVARYYNVQPLYDRGRHGEGRTLGILTLAAFRSRDVFDYWASLGLRTDARRIQVININGGPGAPSDESGSDETTIDVSQAGGLAPAAKIIVYQAPNTDQDFFDMFARAIEDNQAQTLSVSWGSWEWYETNAPDSLGLSAFSNLFLQAALQGQSLFASSGDLGAYDANRGFPVPEFSKILSVDHPAADPWITAAGGTTLPITMTFDGPTAPVTVSIPQERAWGWDYLTGLGQSYGLDAVLFGIFPAGAGGGVSAYFPLPFYQAGLAGIRATEANQRLFDQWSSPPSEVATLPGGFKGRNLPDISLNADPQTGYRLYYTSSFVGFQQVLQGYGGTSFVAPQLNAIATLLGQDLGGRLGLLNVPLYAAARSSNGYGTRTSPLRDITAGNNWGYNAHRGYDQATGLGTLDVDNFARSLKASGY